jgi:hypothetical protein
MFLLLRVIRPFLRTDSFGRFRRHTALAGHRVDVWGDGLVVSPRTVEALASAYLGLPF